MKIETVTVASLLADPANVRTHSPRNIDAIKASLLRFGQQRPLVVDANNVVIAGNGTLEAMRQLGWVDAVIHRSGLAGADRTAYAIADNQTALLAEYDEEALAKTLAALKNDESIDELVTGFDAAEIDAMIADAAGMGEVVEDEVPPPPVNPITKSGDLWLLGEHRLLCGDSRNAEDVARVMGGDRINVAFTSPPYASQRKYDESSGFKPIPPDEYVSWWEPIQANVASHIADDGSFFVNIKPSADGLDTHLYVFDLVLAMVREHGWHFATEFCWERNGVPKSVTRRFKNQFEPIYQFVVGDWKMRPDAVRHESLDVPKARGKGAGNTSRGEHQGANMAKFQGQSFEMFGERCSGMAYPGNRLPTFAGSHEALGHAAAFPVGLPSFFIKAYSDEGDNIYEPFAGSGTAFIAAEQLGRKCFGIEISGGYCDVIVKRWEQFTGRKAERSPC